MRLDHLLSKEPYGDPWVSCWRAREVLSSVLKEQPAPRPRWWGWGVASFVGVALACGGLSALCVGLLAFVGWVAGGCLRFV